MNIQIRQSGANRLMLKLAKIKRTIPQRVINNMEKVGVRLIEEMRMIIESEKTYYNEYSPGKLERDMDVVKAGKGWNVEIYADYAEAVNSGARPHEILPIHGKYLLWYRDGIMHRAKRVSHPGIVGGMFFVERAIDRVADELDDMVFMGIKKEAEL